MKNFLVSFTRLRNHSLQFIGWKIQDILQKRMRRGYYRHEFKRISLQYIQQQFACSKNIGEYMRERKNVKFFTGLNEKENVIKLLSTQYKDYINHVVETADLVYQHKINILTRGEMDLGGNIDWLKDYASGLRWEPAYFIDLDILDFNRSSDVRVVWDLNRLYFLVDLGIAYSATHDERYAEKFKEFVYNWCDANPVAYTINWVYSMEVGIRAINLIWAFEFFLPSLALNDEIFNLRFVQILITHARFIMRNLEYNDYASNHYIANLTALIFLGLYLPEYPESKKWLKTGIRGLENEIRKQVYDDGVDYEKSLPYHRLVTEMFLSAAIFYKQNDRRFSQTFTDRLEKMVEFVQAYLQPDGTCPLIGDNDDGRLWKLGYQFINDHRYILSTGAVFFNRADFKLSAQKFWEESMWLLGTGGEKAFREISFSKDKLGDIKSKAFSKGGFYIMRHLDDHLIIDCGDAGRRGIGGHGHNDVLGYTLCLSGENILTDSGNSQYTANREARFQSIGTRAHNMAMVDDTEIAQFIHLGIGGVSNTPFRVIEWHSNEVEDYFSGEHYGYHRLPGVITHCRAIRYDKQTRRFHFTDKFLGTGRHKIESFFHFSPIMDVESTTEYFKCKSLVTQFTYIVKMLNNVPQLHIERNILFESYGVGQSRWKGIATGEWEFPVTLQYEIYREIM